MIACLELILLNDLELGLVARLGCFKGAYEHILGGHREATLALTLLGL